MSGLIFQGAPYQALCRKGITDLADYVHQFAVADIKLVGPVVGLPGADQTYAARIRHLGLFGMAMLQHDVSPSLGWAGAQLAFSSPIKAAAREAPDF
jgi:hypothetical protein